MLKRIGLAALILLMLLLLMPALIVKSCGGPKPPEVESEPCIVVVWNHKTQELMRLPLEEYLMGVVAAEAPVSFELEALKAQAIVARTYTVAKLRRTGGRGCDKRPEADICTDPTHCQAWLSKEDAMANWPFFKQRGYWQKICQAVLETEGLVITYQGKLIDAVYHSTCGGSTENSEDVWTNQVAYLRSVPCGFCSESPRFTETVVMTTSQVAEKLGAPKQDLCLEVTTSAASGRIISVKTGKETITGLEFRKRLGLRSSRVSWLQEEDKFSFTTVGYGHGVGLCQYGANGMAEQGRLAQEIIKAYYTGVEIVAGEIGE